MLAVIIVDYNSLDITANYVKHCTDKIKGDNIHYIVVDNYQSDDSIIDAFMSSFSNNHESILLDGMCINIIEYKDSEIIYVKSGENLGYAKGNNLGINIAKKVYEDSYYLISNNDIVIPNEIHIDDIIGIFKKDENIAVVGPRIVGNDGKPQSPHKSISANEHLVKYYISLATRGIIKWDNDLDYTNESKYCFRVMGSFMFVRSDYMHEVSCFDPNTFMFAEEMILSTKLLTKGYTTFFCNDITVIHNHGESVKNNSSVERALRWSFDSTSYYYKRYRNASQYVIFAGKTAFNIFIALRRVKHRFRSSE